MDAGALKSRFDAALEAVGETADVETVLALFTDRFTTTPPAQ